MSVMVVVYLVLGLVLLVAGADLLVRGASRLALRFGISPLLIGLTGCTTVARPHLLELLVQLASGETAPSEVMLGNLQLAERCRAALPAGLSVLLALLEERRPTEQAHLFDLLGLCAEVCPSARAQVVEHLTRALATEEEATSDNVTLGQNWLSALRSGP